jgi:hypothetical protein
LRDRSTLHRQELQPAIERVEKRLGNPKFPIEQVKDELGAVRWETIKQATDHTIGTNDHAQKKLTDVIAKLGEILRSRFRGFKFITLVE